MNLFENHDRFVRQNAVAAQGYDVKCKDDKLEKQGASHLRQGREASCFSCKSKSKCKTFEKMRTGGTTGAVSYGGDSSGGQQFLCEKYELMKTKDTAPDNRQIKALLKNAMRGNR